MVISMKDTRIRTYSELIQLPTFKQRYEYLRIGGSVGDETFGYDRYLNQIFYKSKEWLQIRDEIIIRDLGCDLGLKNRRINGLILVHHMNPITKDDILERTDFLLNPEFLISTAKLTHDAIHYGTYESLINNFVIERTENDTCPWRR